MERRQVVNLYSFLGSVVNTVPNKPNLFGTAVHTLKKRMQTHSRGSSTASLNSWRAGHILSMA